MEMTAAPSAKWARATRSGSVQFPDNYPPNQRRGEPTSTPNFPGSRHRPNTMTKLEEHSWTFGRDEYDRKGLVVRIGDAERIIAELDHFKTFEMQVHEDSACNTVTYLDGRERRELYSTKKFVFLALQREILSKYDNQITVDKVLDVCKLDPKAGKLVVV